MSWKQFRLFTECCFTGGTRHAARRSFITLKPVSLQNLDGPDPIIKIRSTPTSRTVPNLNNNGIPYFLNDQSGRTIVQHTQTTCYYIFPQITWNCSIFYPLQRCILQIVPLVSRLSFFVEFSSPLIYSPRVLVLAWLMLRLWLQSVWHFKILRSTYSTTFVRSAHVLEPMT